MVASKPESMLQPGEERQKQRLTVFSVWVGGVGGVEGVQQRTFQETHRHNLLIHGRLVQCVMCSVCWCPSFTICLCVSFCLSLVLRRHRSSFTSVSSSYIRPRCSARFPHRISPRSAHLRFSLISASFPQCRVVLSLWSEDESDPM